MRAPWNGSDVLVGTGGLGTGIFFALEGDETVGREESRGGYLLDSRDYGKLHIVCHYVSALLSDEFLVVPIGRVGRDPAGQSVRRDLHDAGVDTSHVGVDQAHPTMFSVCFTYPSGEGGNLTALNSASSQVSSTEIEAAQPLFHRFRGRGIALAVPEVPMAARATLLSGALAELSPAERETLHSLMSRIMASLVRSKEGGAWICRLCDLDACGRPSGHCPAANSAAAKYATR